MNSGSVIRKSLILASVTVVSRFRSLNRRTSANPNKHHDPPTNTRCDGRER